MRLFTILRMRINLEEFSSPGLMIGRAGSRGGCDGHSSIGGIWLTIPLLNASTVLFSFFSSRDGSCMVHFVYEVRDRLRHIVAAHGNSGFSLLHQYPRIKKRFFSSNVDRTTVLLADHVDNSELIVRVGPSKFAPLPTCRTRDY